MSSRGWRWLPKLAEDLALPGLTLHFILRKRFIEDSVNAVLADGVTQVVIFGAGFDTLAWRLHSLYPTVSFFEIDHPATQAIKRTALARCGDNLHFVAADFTHWTPHQILKQCVGLRLAQPTLFVIEGVLMYLTPPEVEALFAALPHLARDRVILSVMETRQDGRTGFHNATFLADRILRLWREPFRSSFSRFALEAFLARHGYALPPSLTQRSCGSTSFPKARSESQPGVNSCAWRRAAARHRHDGRRTCHLAD